jgi:hypothetical protein
MAQQVSMKNTKAQILDAYAQLQSEHEQLQARYKKLIQERDQLAQRVSTPAAKVTAETPKRAAPLSAQSVNAIVEGLATLRAGFGGALNDLSSQLTAEVAALQALRRQIQEKTDRLQTLYGISVNENTLDELIETYIAKSQAYEEQIKQKREAFEQTLDQKRESWAQEVKAQAQAIKERDDRLKTERKREAQEFEYDLRMARALEAEQYEQDMRARYRELEATVAAKQQAWAKREKAIAEQEQTYRNLESRAGSLAKELESAIKQAEKDSTDMARREAKIRDDALAKEEEGNKRVAELKIASLQATIDKQAQQMAGLSAQLDAVVKQSQSLAVKAIEGASHETSFQSIREIALEQAKRPPKSQ